MSSLCQSGFMVDNSLVQVGADLPGRADDHALARDADELAHLGAAGLPVLDHVLAELADPVRGAVDGVHRGDPLLEALALGVVQARGHLVGRLVELAPASSLSGRLSSISRDS